MLFWRKLVVWQPFTQDAKVVAKRNEFVFSSVLGDHEAKNLGALHKELACFSGAAREQGCISSLT